MCLCMNVIAVRFLCLSFVDWCPLSNPDFSLSSSQLLFSSGVNGWLGLLPCAVLRCVASCCLTLTLNLSSPRLPLYCPFFCWSVCLCAPSTLILPLRSHSSRAISRFPTTLAPNTFSLPARSALIFSPCNRFPYTPPFQLSPFTRFLSITFPSPPAHISFISCSKLISLLQTRSITFSSRSSFSFPFLFSLHAHLHLPFLSDVSLHTQKLNPISPRHVSPVHASVTFIHWSTHHWFIHFGTHTALHWCQMLYCAALCFGLHLASASAQHLTAFIHTVRSDSHPLGMPPYHIKTHGAHSFVSCWH